MDEAYASAAGVLGETLRDCLLKVLPEGQREATEIRLRAGRPLCVMACTKPYFVSPSGRLLSRPEGAKRVEAQELRDSFAGICGWAVHSHQRELAQGYIAVRGGHRAGIAATAVLEKDGQVSAARDISSINLRIARRIYGAADGLVQGCFLGKAPEGVLLCGAPASGKTTVLRDLARQLSSGGTGEYLKVCVVDETGEIGDTGDLGACCDLLSGYPKSKGLEIAVRYLSPQVIICDEIAGEREIEAVAMACNSGVAVVTSLHAASYEELRRKNAYLPLMETGAFSSLALLEGAARPSAIREIRRVEPL